MFDKRRLLERFREMGGGGGAAFLGSVLTWSICFFSWVLIGYLKSLIPQDRERRKFPPRRHLRQLRKTKFPGTSLQIRTCKLSSLSGEQWSFLVEIGRLTTGSTLQSNMCVMLPCMSCIIFGDYHKHSNLQLGHTQPSTPAPWVSEWTWFCYQAEGATQVYKLL